MIANALDIAIAPGIHGAIAMRFTVLDLDSPRFPSSKVAEVAGMEINTFRSNFKRGHFRMVGEDASIAKPAERHGLPHLFSLRDAIGVAIAGDLMRAGVSAKQAWEVGLWTFAHTGTADRNPGELYDNKKHGWTVMVFWPSVQRAEILPMTATQGLSFSQLFYDPASRLQQDAAVLLFLDRIHQRVVLALDPNQRHV